MQESNLAAPHAAAGRLIYQTNLARPKLSKRSFNIFDFKTKVMKALTSLGEEPAYDRVVAHRFEKFYAAFPDRQPSNVHALLPDSFPSGALKAERTRIESKRFVNRANGNTDVVKLHRRSSSSVKSE